MHSLSNLPILNHKRLEQILESRFNSHDEKLSNIPQPHLFKDATKAIDRLERAIKNREKITLVGDYDVDGVTATAIVKQFFSLIPYPLESIIPNRFSDGYGVSPNILDRVDADVVITVDNGISAIEAAEICKSRGIDLIITDHHAPLEILPDAYAIVDPKQSDCSYPSKDICGAQVAWLMMAYLKQRLDLQIDMRQFLPFLTLAIIADVMPLLGANRSLVKSGLEAISSSTLPAFVLIRDILGKNSISSEDIAFLIAPRLNSAGRLEDASIALEFLLSKNLSDAAIYFDRLTTLNNLRKEIESATTEEAKLLVDDSDKIIVVASEGWNEGVVGIVASRLVNLYQKPSIVLSINNDRAKGSARSVGEVNLHSLLQKCEDILLGFGGHKMAAGLSLERDKIESFKIAINAEADKLSADDFIAHSDVLGILPQESIDLSLLELLERYEPYGEANPRPKFLIKDAVVDKIRLFGSDNSHSKIDIKTDRLSGKTTEFIAFRRVLEFNESKTISCSYSVNKNEWQGRISMQLMIDRIYE